MYAASGCPAELYATPRQTRGVQLDGASRRAQARGFALAFLRALLDLKEELGFEVGPWNQAYLFDTLPQAATPQELQPGDLVFWTATYDDPERKKQRQCAPGHAPFFQLTGGGCWRFLLLLFGLLGGLAR